MSTIIDLSKKAKISLEKKEIFGEKAQVVLILDKSLSMQNFYECGVVQQTVERVLGVGMNMDDNQSIEVFAFDQEAVELEEATASNYEGYVERMLKKTSLGYQTRYSLPMKLVLDKFVPKAPTKTTGFFRKKTVATGEAEIAKLPTFVIFITDGDNQDKKETEALIREASNQAVFWQFVGIGREQFSFLQKMDDMDGRFLDNVDFFPMEDPSKVSDGDLYDKLLTEFPQWIKEARAKGILQ